MRCGSGAGRGGVGGGRAGSVAYNVPHAVRFRGGLRVAALGWALGEVVARQEACEPFELAAGPVLRGELVRVAADDHVLLLTVHHIASDGWSSGVLVREVLELYPRFGAGGGGAVLAPLPVQYADFAVWQRGWLRGEVLADLVGEWRHWGGGGGSGWRGRRCCGCRRTGRGLRCCPG